MRERGIQGRQAPALPASLAPDKEAFTAFCVGHCRSERADAACDHVPMAGLRYLLGYPEHLQEQVRRALAAGRLDAWLAERYPEQHEVQSDKALYAYTMALKQAHLRNAPGIDKVRYDAKLDVVRNALGLHTAISRVHGGRLRAKKEIRIASVFRQAPAAFLETIVVHELAHLKEAEHNKAFYQLCEHMQPDYHQREFDLRVYLTWRDLVPAAAEAPA